MAGHYSNTSEATKKTVAASVTDILELKPAWVVVGG